MVTRIYEYQWPPPIIELATALYNANMQRIATIDHKKYTNQLTFRVSVYSEVKSTQVYTQTRQAEE